jgi:hypothetical protein
VSSESGSGVAREWATRVVQWNPARTAVKRGVHAYAAVRGARLERAGRVPDIGNIYAASSQKAGSQWMKALLDHPEVRASTGLFTLPQLDYQRRPDKAFPAGTFVPGLYCGYDEYRRRPQPRPHRVIYMFRDPRDLVVSGYYSAVETHRKMDRKGEALFNEIRSRSFDDGLLYLIHSAAPRLQEMASWVGVDDAAVATFRLEDVAANPREEVAGILKHCGVELTPAAFETVLSDVSRDSLQKKDLAHRKEGEESHYRVNRRSFRDVFQPAHYEAIEAIVPDLAKRLRYPD